MSPSPHIKLAPSILAADLARLGEQVAEATKAGADYIHVDVMDGRFVPNLTFGPPVVAAIRSWTTLPLDVHLMVVEPESLVPAFAKAGADIITVHQEACTHLHRLAQQIRESGKRAGVAINPMTPISAIEEALPFVDQVTVMTVNPGFAGQEFIDLTAKIARLRAMLDEKGLAVDIEVDGGISPATAPRVAQAGATVLVAGAAVFNNKMSVAEAIARLRQSVASLKGSRQT